MRWVVVVRCPHCPALIPAAIVFFHWGWWRVRARGAVKVWEKGGRMVDPMAISTGEKRVAGREGDWVVMSGSE